MIKVKGPDGSIANFPDGTPPEVMQNAMRQKFGGPQQQAAPPVAAPPSQPPIIQTSSPLPQTSSSGEYDAAPDAPPATFDPTPPTFMEGVKNADTAIRSAAITAADQGSFGAIPWMARKAAGLFGADPNVVQNEVKKANDYLGPTASGAIGIGAQMLPASKMIQGVGAGARAIGMTGKLADIGVNAVGGAGIGAADALGHGGDVTSGAGVGALAGAGGGLVGQALGGIGNMVSRARLPPEQKAAAKIYDMLQKSGNDPAALQKMVTDLGPEAMVVDALGKHGTALGRASANIDPAARETLSSAMLGRSEGQNQRLADTIFEAAGLPAGSRVSADKIKEMLSASAQPGINAAYHAAEQAGAVLDWSKLTQIMRAPAVKSAYGSAMKSIRNLEAADGNPATFNNALSRLDLAKQKIDDMAGSAFSSGEPQKGREMSIVAKGLRGKIDEAMGSSEYADARRLAGTNFKSLDAVDAGAAMAMPNARNDVIAAGKAAQAENAGNVAQGYAAQQAENLLGKRSMAGTVNGLMTPMARESYQAALGAKGAAKVDNALKSERAFNASKNDLTGNSTTAQQLRDMLSGGVATGLAGAGVAYQSGQDMWSSGALGALAGALRKGVPAGIKKMTEKNAMAIAPHIAEMLTRRVLPNAPAGASPTAQQVQAIIRMLSIAAPVAASQSIR